MQVQSAGEQPARPTPEAATTSPSWPYQLPLSPQDAVTAIAPGATGLRCESGFYILFVKHFQSSFCWSVSLLVTATLSLCTLRNFPQLLCSLQHYSTLTAWERQTWRKKRGTKERGRRVLLGCSLTVLFVQPFFLPGSPQREQLSISTHVLSVFCTHKHMLQILTSLIHRKENTTDTAKEGEPGLGIQTWAEWGVKGCNKILMNDCHRHANTRHAKTDMEITATTKDYKLAEHMYIYCSKAHRYQILQGRGSLSTDLLMQHSKNQEKNPCLLLIWPSYPSWFSNGALTCLSLSDMF